MLWEFRHITSKENEELREGCMVEVPVTGKPGMYRPRLRTNEYIRRMITASVVFPDLYDAGLADKIEGMFCEMLAGPGAVRAALQNISLSSPWQIRAFIKERAERSSDVYYGAVAQRERP